MLKLYTDKQYLTETYRRQVFPLLFDLVYKKNKLITKYYKLVDRAIDSDIIVMPIDYNNFIKNKEAYKELLKTSKSYNKPFWIYSAGDYGYTNTIKNSFTFRLGGFNNKMPKETFIMPSFINDPYKTFLSHDFSTIEKEDKPNIGFVGHAKSGVNKYIKEYFNHLKHRIRSILTSQHVDKQRFYPSSTKRAKYLKELAINVHFNTQFVLRNQYRAGLHSAQTQNKSAQEFYNNIYNTAYTFCIRGVGNFSVRFYEALAVGRIPILLNTDCRLPLNNNIDWSRHCLILDVKSKLSIAEQILSFHSNLSFDEFDAIQKSNRQLWLNTLRRDVYFVEIYKQFKS